MKVYVVSFENSFEIGGGILGIYLTEAKAKRRARNYMKKRSKEKFSEIIFDKKAKFFVLEDVDKEFMVIVERYKIIK